MSNAYANVMLMQLLMLIPYSKNMVGGNNTGVDSICINPLAW